MTVFKGSIPWIEEQDRVLRQAKIVTRIINELKEIGVDIGTESAVEILNRSSTMSGSEVNGRRNVESR